MMSMLRRKAESIRSTSLSYLLHHTFVTQFEPFLILIIGFEGRGGEENGVREGEQRKANGGESIEEKVKMEQYGKGKKNMVQ